MPHPFLITLCALCGLAISPLRTPAAEELPSKWTTAHNDKLPMTAAETRAFIHRLANYVLDHHMKKDAESPQHGMTYEYFDPAKAGHPDQFVQGEALDTMHDGAWFALAMTSAYRATGDDFYKKVLTDQQLPFYCKMLNHSDQLFNKKSNHARPDRQKTWTENKEWLLQDGENGFVPYWWDDGGSVSLERVQTKNPLPDYPAHDNFVAAGKPNPSFLLSGYSLGSSHHLAQDLGVMLQQSWLLLRDDPKWNAELAEAAKNLQQCRTNHGSPNIPAVVAAAALITGDAKLMQRATDGTSVKFFEPDNHYTRALYAFKPGQKYTAPGFADDQEYLYYSAIARTGGHLPKPLAFKLIYDAYTLPMLYRAYSDDAKVPPGINVFDLHPYTFIDGKPADYRSDRNGPANGPRPIGSRFGPQNMAISGLALQALNKYPGIWEERYKTQFPDDLRVFVEDRPYMGYMGASNTPITLGGIQMEVISTRTAFRMTFRDLPIDTTIKIHSRPDQKGTHAILTIKKNGEFTGVNDAGQKLYLDVVGGNAKDNQPVISYMALPYTARKDPQSWANGVEHQRYSLEVNGQSRNFYLASDDKLVRLWLERELAGGLRTWEAIFDELGYIPTGIGEPRWERFSDTGAYAHLIKAAAQWIEYQEGKRDWESHNFPNGK